TATIRRETKPALFHPDRNLFRNERWVERIVLGIAQHQLQRVLSWRQLDACFSLACSEVKMALVLRDRLVGIERIVQVDKQWMMAAVLEFVARMSDAHVAQAKAAPEPALDGRAVLRPDEVENRVLSGRLSLCLRRERRQRQRRR